MIRKAGPAFCFAHDASPHEPNSQTSRDGSRNVSRDEDQPVSPDQFLIRRDVMDRSGPCLCLCVSLCVCGVSVSLCTRAHTHTTTRACIRTHALTHSRITCSSTRKLARVGVDTDADARTCACTHRCPWAFCWRHCFSYCENQVLLISEQLREAERAPVSESACDRVSETE